MESVVAHVDRRVDWFEGLKVDGQLLCLPVLRRHFTAASFHDRMGSETIALSEKFFTPTYSFA